MVALPTTPCPGCAKDGRAVKPETLRALLRAPPDDTGGFRFCETLECRNVWYRPRDGLAFTEADLTVPVGRKRTDPERPVCYCFDHDARSIAEDGEAIEASIRARCKAGDDRCTVTNPEGRCCLGEVRRVREAEAPVIPAPSSCCRTETKPDPTAARASTVGAIVAAVLSSACCWLPLTAIALGVSTAGVAGFLEAWRWPLMGLSAALLLVAFFLGRGGLPRIVLGTATVAVAAFAFLPDYLTSLLPAEPAPPPVSRTATAQSIQIQGMTCESCAVHLRAALSDIPGVVRAEVEYATRTARIWIAPGAEVEGSVETTVEAQGYRVLP